MCRWTNQFPFYFNNVKFIEEDSAHLDEFLSDWLEMAKVNAGEEVEAMRGIEEGERERIKVAAKAHAPYGGLNPIQYGLIVVDYKTHTILDCQSYSGVGSIDAAGVELALMEHDDLQNGHDSRPFYRPSDEEYQRYQALFDSNRIKQVRLRDFSCIDAPPKMTIRDFVEKDELSDRYRSAELDMSPWTVKRFRQSVEGFSAMKQEVLKLGFVLTQEENDHWEEFIDRWKN